LGDIKISDAFICMHIEIELKQKPCANIKHTFMFN